MTVAVAQRAAAGLLGQRTFGRCDDPVLSRFRSTIDCDFAFGAGSFGDVLAGYPGAGSLQCNHAQDIHECIRSRVFVIVTFHGFVVDALVELVHAPRLLVHSEIVMLVIWAAPVSPLVTLPERLEVEHLNVMKPEVKVIPLPVASDALNSPVYTSPSEAPQMALVPDVEQILASSAAAALATPATAIKARAEQPRGLGTSGASFGSP